MHAAMLFNYVESPYMIIDSSAESFDELPQQAQDDLLGWFNCADPSDDDKDRLLELYQQGRFFAWDCPEQCGNRVYHGSPSSYDDFQGVLNQDFALFPGNRLKYTENYLEVLCDDCRGAV